MKYSRLIALALSLLIIVLSAAQTIYRAGLPTEGWSYTRDSTGAGLQLRFDRSLTGQPTALRPGDILVSAAGQSIDEMLVAALSLRTQRPPDWEAGRSVPYTILRGRYEIKIYVPLVHLPTRVALVNVLRNLLLNPAPLLSICIAFFLFFRDRRSRTAPVMLLFSAVAFASDGISQGINGTNIPGPAELYYPAAFWALQIINYLWPLLVAPLYIHLLLSFPLSSAPIQRYGNLALPALYALTPVLTANVVFLHWGNPLGFWRAWSAVTLIYFICVLALAILIMLFTLLTASEIEGRAQIRWVAAGTVLTSLGALAGSAVLGMRLQGDSFLVAWTVTRLLLLGLPVGVAIAVLRYRLFDIDIVLHNTLIYGILTGLLSVLYFASTLLLQSFFRAVSGVQSPAAVVISTLLIAASFIPLRSRVQKAIDRRMFREKYNAEGIVSSFSVTVRNEVDMEQISARLLRAVDDTMQPHSASLWLRPGTHTQRKEPRQYPPPTPHQDSL